MLGTGVTPFSYPGIPPPVWAANNLLINLEPNFGNEGMYPDFTPLAANLCIGELVFANLV